MSQRVSNRASSNRSPKVILILAFEKSCAEVRSRKPWCAHSFCRPGSSRGDRWRPWMGDDTVRVIGSEAEVSLGLAPTPRGWMNSFGEDFEPRGALLHRCIKRWPVFPPGERSSGGFAPCCEDTLHACSARLAWRGRTGHALRVAVHGVIFKLFMPSRFEHSLFSDTRFFVPRGALLGSYKKVPPTLTWAWMFPVESTDWAQQPKGSRFGLDCLFDISVCELRIWSEKYYNPVLENLRLWPPWKTSDLFGRRYWPFIWWSLDFQPFRIRFGTLSECRFLIAFRFENLK